MLTRSPVATVALLGALVALPGVARAQYKNSAFGLDVGGWMFPGVPTAIDPISKDVILKADERPLRLATGFRAGGEGNFKMDEDHVWFTARVNAGFLQFPKGNKSGTADEKYDFAAREALGTLMGVEGQIGIRYVFLTDRFRPYLQGALSFLRLMSFKTEATCDSTSATYCEGDNNNFDTYLPHPNVGAVHLQPGVELVIKRDVAIHLFIDLHHFFILNAPDDNGIVLGAGMIFFT